MKADIAPACRTARSKVEAAFKAETVAELQAKGVVGLTKSQMAAALQVSVRRLNGMMFRKEIVYWRIGRRLVRFRVEDAVGRMNQTVLVIGG